MAMVLVAKSLSSDLWSDLSQTGISVFSSQSGLVYDADSSRLWHGAGGHPPQGGYPQFACPQYFSLLDNTWYVDRPQGHSPKYG